MSKREVANLAGTSGRMATAAIKAGGTVWHSIPVESAGVLYPFFGWLLSPIIAGAVMSLSSVSVIGNVLRLRNVML